MTSVIYGFAFYVESMVHIIGSIRSEYLNNKFVIKLNLVDLNKSKLNQMTLMEFLKNDNLKSGQYLIESLFLPAIIEQSLHKIKAYKVSVRAQNSHSYVNAGKYFILFKKYYSCSGKIIS